MRVEGSGQDGSGGAANATAADSASMATEGAVAGAGTEGQAGQGGDGAAGAGSGDAGNAPAAAGGDGDAGAADGGSSEGQADAGDPAGEGGAGSDEGGNAPGLTVPEGMAITPEWQEKLTTYATARGLDHAAQQEIVDMGVQLHQQLLESITDAHNDRVASWEQEARQEHGARFDAVVAAAQSAFARFGSPQLKELMVQYGIGNHPAMLNAFAQIASAVREPTDVPGGGTGQAAPSVDDNSEEARAQRMYGAATKPSGRRGGR
jgi:hypothetical protein